MINKKILILGGTGFIGHVLKNILEINNNVTLIGSSEKVSFKIGENVSYDLEELILNNDLIIFASWNFKLKKSEYINQHLKSVKELISKCKKHNKAILFISTALAKEKSKSIYNKTKYLCENEIVLNNQSLMRIGVINSDLNFEGNIYLKLAKLPTFFGFKILLKPDNPKFYIEDIEMIKEFLETFSFSSPNIYKNNSEPIPLSNVINLFTKKKNKFLYINWKIPYIFIIILNNLGIRSRLSSDSFLSIWGED